MNKNVKDSQDFSAFVENLNNFFGVPFYPTFRFHPGLARALYNLHNAHFYAIYYDQDYLKDFQEHLPSFHFAPHENLAPPPLRPVCPAPGSGHA